jgi:modulator of FtsH protease HflK
MANELRLRIQSALDKLNVGPDGIPRGTGIEILFVGPEGVHPPKDTAEGFENVVNAQQKRERRILLAQARSIETLTSVVGSVDLAERIVEEIDRADRMNTTSTTPTEVALQEQRIESLLAEAGGEASTTILDASAERWSTHMAARANATQYTGQIASYLANPTLYTASARFEALANAMKDSRVYITDDRIPLHIRMNLEDRQTSVDVFDADTDLE